MIWLLFAGAMGAIVRLFLDRALPPVATTSARCWHGWPWGILLANLLGTFALGLVLGYAKSHSLSLTPELFASVAVPADRLWVLAAGFCGSLTTVSTLFVGFHGLYLAKPARGIAYLLTTVILAGLVAWLGVQLSS